MARGQERLCQVVARTPRGGQDKAAVTADPPITIGAHWNFFASGISNSIGANPRLRKELDQLDPNLPFVFTVYPTVNADYLPPTNRLLPL